MFGMMMLVMIRYEWLLRGAHLSQPPFLDSSFSPATMSNALPDLPNIAK